MLILGTILIASAALSTLDASAIKGDSRSLKSAPVSDNLDKINKLVPILESTKKIYNDESIRRLASVPALEQAVRNVEPVRPVQPVVQQAQPVQAAAQVEPVVPAAPVPVPASGPALALASAPAPALAPVQAQVQLAKKDEVVAPSMSAPASLEPLHHEVSVPAKAPVPVPVPAQSQAQAQVEPMVPVVPIQAQPIIQAQAPAQAESVVPVMAPVSAPVSVSAPAQAPAQAQAQVQQAKKDEVFVSPSMSAPVSIEPLHIEVPAPDPGLVLSEPIDSTTKLLIDLDEHVQKFLPAEDQQQLAQPNKEQTLVAGVDYSPAVPVQANSASSADSEKVPSGKSSGPLVPYSGAEDPIVPPLPSLEGVEKASAGSSAAVSAVASAVSAAAAPTQPVSLSSSAASPSATRQGGQGQSQQQVINQLLEQLDSLQNRIQDTINQLVARRRYVMSALLRPMGTYVRRVRTNLERLQNRVNQLQAAAASVGGGGGNRPGGFVDAAAIETIRRRIDDISKRISDIVNRIRFSLTPTSAPLNNNGRK